MLFAKLSSGPIPNILKKCIIFLLFILFYLGGFYTSETSTKKKVTSCIQTEKLCQSQLKQTIVLAKKNTTQDICLSTQKEKALEKVQDSKVYFSIKTSQKSEIETDIVISLLGGLSMKVDASDLVLNYTDNLTILEIIPGQSFPIYPRKIAENGVVTITGIARLDGSGVKLGESNTVFATLRVQKTGDIKQKASITLNTTNTSAYLEGRAVIDSSLTFGKIEL